MTLDTATLTQRSGTLDRGLTASGQSVRLMFERSTGYTVILAGEPFSFGHAAERAASAYLAIVECHVSEGVCS